MFSCLIDLRNEERPEAFALANGTILLEETEELLKENFARALKHSKYSTLADLLQHNRDFVKESTSKAQFRLLNSKGKHVTLSDIDLPLTVLLLKSLLNIKEVDNVQWSGEGSLGDQIVRINRIRNVTLGFLLKPDKTWNMDVVYNNLCESLNVLGISKRKQVKLNALILYPDLSRALTVRQNLEMWISRDKQGMIELFERMEPHLKTNKMLKPLYKDHCMVTSDLKGNYDKILSILRKLPLNIMMNVLCHQPHHNLEGQSEAIAEKLKQTFQDEQRKLAEKVDILAKSGTLQHDLKQHEHYPSEMIHSVKTELLDPGELFRVLILDSPRNNNDKYIDDFCKALGCVPWDVIIDLDYQSRTTSGLHERCAKVLKTHKDYQVVAYNQEICVSDSDKKIIANGEKTLWYLANGCEDTGIEPIQKRQFEKTLTPLGSLLTAIISKTSCGKPLSIWNIIMGNQVSSLLQKLLQRLDGISESVEEHILLAKSCLYNMCTEESIIGNIPCKELEMETKTGCVTYQDFSNVFRKKLNRNEKRYIYPGSDGRQCELSEDEMVQHQVYVDLYHFDSGKMDFTDKSPYTVAEMMERERTDFLKGNPLTPEAQFVHPKRQVYVEREEMKEIKKKICRLLTERGERTRRRDDVGHFTIHHDSSGGGTTTARYLLYTLRETYPCLEIKRIDPQTTKYLDGLSKESRSPLLLVLDDHEFSAKNADVLQQELENSNIKALVIYVQRDKPNPLGDNKDHTIKQYGKSKYDHYISSELKPEDKEGFRQLYQKVQASKVFLFGLLAFCEEYDRSRLNHHISAGMASASPQQKEALAMVLFTWKYCQKPVKLKFFDFGHDALESNRNFQDVFGYHNCDFVKKHAKTNLVSPIHQCVVDPILEFLMKERGDTTEATFLKWFMDILFLTLSKTSTMFRGNDQMCRQFFIERKDDHMSLLVKDLGDKCGKEYTSKQILKFSQLYRGQKQEGHMRALYARYLTYQMEELDKGLEEIRVAVGLKVGETVQTGHTTNETAILGTYGNLYREKATKVFKSQKDSDAAITQSLVYFQEAVDAFQKAQQLTLASKQYIADNFLGEVRARHRLLSLCFWNRCKGKFAQFREFQKVTEYQLIKDSGEKALEVLDRLDNLQRLNKLDEISERTSKEIWRFKFMLLKLNFEETSTKKSLIAFTKKEPNICFDIGLIVRMKYDSIRSVSDSSFQYHLTEWGSLPTHDLLTIITFVQQRVERGSAKLHSCNYDDLLTAMIYLRYREKPSHQYPQYNIGYAIECAKKWRHSFPQDHRASFTLGALYLVKGIGDDIKDDLKEGMRLLKKCEEICAENISARLVMVKRWSIGLDTGLKMLIPYRKETEASELAAFNGRQTHPRSALIRVKPYGEVMLASVYGDNRRKVDDGQHSNLRFNICLRHKDPLCAYNVQKV